MASRRSHAPTHSRNANQHRVPMGHVSIRNPLQAPKERSCGINNPPHPNLVPLRGPRSSYSISLLSKAAWLRRDVIASYDYPFLLCNQTVGFHPEMGRFWISKDYPYNDEFSAYMVAKIYRAEGIAS